MADKTAFSSWIRLAKVAALGLVAFVFLATKCRTARADDANCPLFSCITGSCFDTNDCEEKKDEPKCSYGPCCCQPRKTLMQWSYGTSFSGGPPGMDEPLESDRPGFTESPTTVGRGVVQLETGYVYSLDNHAGDRRTNNAFPDTLWRIGMFAEWFEWRIEYNYEIQNDTISNGVLPSIHQRTSGSDDLLLGIKLCLTPQEGILPQMGLNPLMSVPSGSPGFTQGAVMPGVAWLYNWKLSEKWILEGLTSVIRERDDDGNDYTQFAQAFNLQYQITKKLQFYIEWFVTSPTGRTSDRTTQNADGGFSYQITNNFQLDAEVGVGLNEAADDFLAGGGAVVRF